MKTDRFLSPRDGQRANCCPERANFADHERRCADKGASPPDSADCDREVLGQRFTAGASIGENGLWIAR